MAGLTRLVTSVRGGSIGCGGKNAEDAITSEDCTNACSHQLPIDILLLNHRFTESLIHWIILSLINQPLLHWFIESLIYWTIDSFIRCSIDSLIHRFIGSLLGWFIESLLRCYIDSLIHWFIGSSIHWLIGISTLIGWCTSQLQPLMTFASQNVPIGHWFLIVTSYFEASAPARAGHYYRTILYIIYTYTYIFARVCVCVCVYV